MTLVKTIEQIDPGHFARRQDILENLRTKVRAMGFFPLPLTQNDIECFWITLQPNNANKDKKISVDREGLDWEPYIEALKEVARYEQSLD